ncbi:hypothetical protein [Nocardia sp. SYP-A9097]|uniref:hypothetical protein n=1 Tax=Nocardia sp. SYP-A9097 TaxID=2663237 RepID=UPI00129ADF5C|nr:hypothetical protein [Nocardia sp. SYP-A9097]
MYRAKTAQHYTSVALIGFGIELIRIGIAGIIYGDVLLGTGFAGFGIALIEFGIATLGWGVGELAGSRPRPAPTPRPRRGPDARSDRKVRHA